GVAQKKSGFWGKAHAEARDGFVIQAAADKVFAGVSCLGPAQLSLKEGAGTLVHIEQRRAELCFFGFGGSIEGGLGQRNANLLRNRADGFGKGNVFQLLHEAEDVTRSAAAEAVIELARCVDGKRRRLLAVEGTEPGKVLRSGFL